MANVYVYSGAAGAGTGADWTNAYTTLAAAFTAKAAGDDFWVANDHAETTAGLLTPTSPGTATSPCRVICVSRAGSTPPVSADLATTATISTTGNNSLALTAKYTYYYGITFTAGNSSGLANLSVGSNFASNPYFGNFKSCAFRLGGTGATSVITIGNGSANADECVKWDNCTVQFGSTSQSIVHFCGFFDWSNTASAVTGATLPTTLFANNTGSVPGITTLEGVDLSALGSGKTLVGATTSSHLFTFKDCKLGASVTVAATPTAGPGAGRVRVIRCDSGATNYRTEDYHFAGTQTTETTIVRTGGASDGTTPVAWKLVTTANSKRYIPYEALPIAIWGDTTASTTVTVYGIWGGGAVPTNADIWMDIEYLGSALTPQASFATAGPADQLAAGSNLTTDSSTWGGSTTKFKMSVTFTPAQKGAINIYIKAATASSTFYIDPKPVLT